MTTIRSTTAVLVTTGALLGYQCLVGIPLRRLENPTGPDPKYIILDELGLFLLLSAGSAIALCVVFATWQVRAYGLVAVAALIVEGVIGGYVWSLLPHDWGNRRASELAIVLVLLLTGVRVWAPRQAGCGTQRSQPAG